MNSLTTFNSQVNYNSTIAGPITGTRMTSTTTTTPNITYPGIAVGTTADFKWTQAEKEALVKIGFKFNKEIHCWELDLTATISIPQNENILEYVNQHNRCDKAVKLMKELKEKLIKKLTAKMILIELSKPREIKE